MLKFFEPVHKSLTRCWEYCFAAGEMAINYHLELTAHAENHISYKVTLTTKNVYKNNGSFGFYAFIRDIDVDIQNNTLNINHVCTEMENIKKIIQRNIEQDDVQYRIAYFRKTNIPRKFIHGPGAIPEYNNWVKFSSQEILDALFNKIQIDIIDDVQIAANHLLESESILMTRYN